MAVTAEQVVDAAQLDDPSGRNETRRLSLAAVALAHVQGYVSSDCPDAAVLEGSIRVFGWLREQPRIALVRDAQGSGGDRSYAVSRTSPLFSSGAAGLLQPWRKGGVGVAEA